MSLVIATLCQEGIAIAADSRAVVSLLKDPKANDKEVKPSGFITTAQKIVVTDNNVAIAFIGRLEIKGRPAHLFFQDYFAERPGLNAKQVAGEANNLLKSEPSIQELEVLVAGMMDGRCRLSDGRSVAYKKPWVYRLSTEHRGKMGKNDFPCAQWMGEYDLMERLFGKQVTVRRGRKKETLNDYQIPFMAFTLQDAIDFSSTWIEMTYRLMRFQDREQTVAPPIEVLVITKEGTRWVKTKGFQELEN